MKHNMKQVDIMDLFQPKNRQQDRFVSRAAVNIHEFYLCGNIESADEYIEWFDIIRHAGPTDVVRIIINSYGGDLFTAIQFLRVLTESEATVVVSVEGACMSAATMIFLAADQFEVSEHSAIMIHTYSGGMIGKGNEMHAQAIFERGWSIDLIKQVYTDFLTEAEIEHVISGGDIWIDAKDCMTRLERLAAARYKDEEIDDAEEIIEVKPKKSKKNSEPKENG